MLKLLFLRVATTHTIEMLATRILLPFSLSLVHHKMLIFAISQRPLGPHKFAPGCLEWANVDMCTKRQGQKHKQCMLRNCRCRTEPPQRVGNSGLVQARNSGLAQTPHCPDKILRTTSSLIVSAEIASNI